MTVTRESDADACAAAMAAESDARRAAEARALDGDTVLLLRAALIAAATVLARINAKGLPFAHRRELEAARAQIGQALPHLATRRQGAPTSTRGDRQQTGRKTDETDFDLRSTEAPREDAA